MAVTTTPRIGVTQWSAGADPFSRAQMNAAFANVELYAARDEQGLEAAKPAPNIRGRWWFSTDAARKHLYRDDGTTLHEVPLIAQRNDFTGINTFALASEAATELTDTLAPVGVSRPAATGHRAYFALAKTAVSYAVGIGGSTADGSTEVNPLIFGVPDASKNIPTPLMYLGSTGTLRNIGTSYSGAYANGAASSTRIASGSVDATNARLAAEGSSSAANLNLESAGGASSVILRPNAVTVLTVAPSLITAAQKVSITAGGLAVAGSPSGYSGFGEVTTSGSGLALTTTATGSPVTSTDHRGSTNTGLWQWSNGTNAATLRMALTGTGELLLGGQGANGGGYKLSILGVATVQPPVFLKSASGASGSGSYQIQLNHGDDPILGWMIGHEGASSGKLKFATDAGGGPTDKLTVTSAGALTASGTISSGGTIQANGGSLASVATGGTVRLYLKATDAAVDAKVWDIAPSGSNLVFRSINDTEVSSVTWMTFTRSAMTMSNVTFGTKINASQVGTATGAGTTAGSVAYADNDAHTWEGGGGGQWYFRNAWNSTNASYTFFGGVGGIQLLSIEAAGHLISGGATPTIATTLGANWSVAVTGTDTAGLITVTNVSGAGQSIIIGATMFTLTFSRAFNSTPRVIVTSANANGQTYFPYFSSAGVGPTTTGFAIANGGSTNPAIGPGNTLMYQYHVIGN